MKSLEKMWLHYYSVSLKSLHSRCYGTSKVDITIVALRVLRIQKLPPCSPVLKISHQLHRLGRCMRQCISGIHQIFLADLWSVCAHIAGQTSIHTIHGEGSRQTQAKRFANSYYMGNHKVGLTPCNYLFVNVISLFLLFLPQCQ